MGPHGLCVGATGSGKSEMLRTLVTALAATHPPEDLSMVLMDYKGGATFAPFASLPHVAGLIDNLGKDAALVERARAAIVGEVIRRQEQLRDAGNCPDITRYRRLRAEEAAMPPMPHLLIVIDEFSDLVAVNPDFVDLLLAIGRIGRSVGVHLLLSSQRFEADRLRGLEAYLSYRICLRTFTEAESRAVLGTDDAFHLPAAPGFGYLKVDTSVYTRFRSGYVSGPVGNLEEDLPQPAEASRCGPALLGAYNGLSATPGPIGTAPARRGRSARVSVVDTVVRRLRGRGTAVAPVWLPPLPRRLCLPQVYGAPLVRSDGVVRAPETAGAPCPHWPERRPHPSPSGAVAAGPGRRGRARGGGGRPPQRAHHPAVDAGDLGGADHQPCPPGLLRPGRHRGVPGAPEHPAQRGRGGHPGRPRPDAAGHGRGGGHARGP